MPLLKMGIKGGVEVLRADLTKDNHIFYMLEILDCGKPYAIKIGKSNDGLQRLSQYDRTYGPHYRITMIRRFQKAPKKHGFDVQGITASSFSDSFERLVIKELKQMEVEPLYTDNPTSDEYYKPRHRAKVLQAIQTVATRLDEAAAKPVPLRRSARPKKPEKRVLRSQAKPAQKLGKRNYQGYETGNYEKPYNTRAR